MENKEKEPQFKIGDEVEVFALQGLQGVFIIIHIDGDTAWVKNKDSINGLLIPFNQLRYPIDKVVEKAEELVSRVIESADWSCYDLFVEAIKWGQENR